VQVRTYVSTAVNLWGTQLSDYQILDRILIHVVSKSNFMRVALRAGSMTGAVYCDTVAM
jgi:hypothetical protein